MLDLFCEGLGNVDIAIAFSFGRGLDLVERLQGTKISRLNGWLKKSHLRRGREEGFGCHSVHQHCQKSCPQSTLHFNCHVFK